MFQRTENLRARWIFEKNRAFSSTDVGRVFFKIPMISYFTCVVSLCGLGSMIPDSSYFDFSLDFDLHYNSKEEDLTCPVSIESSR